MAKFDIQLPKKVNVELIKQEIRKAFPGTSGFSVSTTSESKTMLGVETNAEKAAIEKIIAGHDPNKKPVVEQPKKENEVKKEEPEVVDSQKGDSPIEQISEGFNMWGDMIQEIIKKEADRGIEAAREAIGIATSAAEDTIKNHSEQNTRTIGKMSDEFSQVKKNLMTIAGNQELIIESITSMGEAMEQLVSAGKKISDGKRKMGETQKIKLS